MYKYLGYFLGIASVISLVLLTFGYRDVSTQLVLMFLITLIGLPLSTYLLINHKTYFITFSKEDDDVMDVVGKFTI